MMFGDCCFVGMMLSMGLLCEKALGACVLKGSILGPHNQAGGVGSSPFRSVRFDARLKWGVADVLFLLDITIPF